MTMILIQLDLRSLAAFRILLGLYLLYDIYSRLSLGKYDLAWYTSSDDNGYLSVHDTPHHAPFHEVWFHRGSATQQVVLFGLTGLLSVFFTVGAMNVVVKPLLWFLVTAQLNRNMHVHDGSDTFLRHLLVWSCFLPLDHVWSLSSSKNKCSLKAKAVSPLVTGLPCLALACQIVFMYTATVFHRTLDQYSLSELSQSEWMPPSLSAVHYAISGSFATRHNGLTMWVRQHAVVSRIMTASAMVMEIVLPVGCLFPKTRLVCAVQMILLHAGLLCMLRLPNWQSLGMITQVIWFPSSFWDRRLPQRINPFVNGTTTLSPQQYNVYKKTDGDAVVAKQSTPNSRRDQTNNIHPITGSTSNPVSRFIQLFLFAYMLYNWCGERGWIDKHDNGDIGEALRLSQYWVMYAHVGHTADNTMLTGILVNDGEQDNDMTSERRIDLLHYVQTAGHIQDQLPEDTEIQDMSRRYPSARWERALHGFQQDDRRGGEKRIVHFCQTLCRLIRQDQVPISAIEWRRQHLELRPLGSSKRYGRRERPDTVIQVLCSD